MKIIIFASHLGEFVMKTEIVPVETVEDIGIVEALAAQVWNEHYSAILTKEQISYMLEKFQSAGAIKSQMEEQGYRYFLLSGSVPMGYIAVKENENSLFLSKYYILKEFRGAGHASAGFAFIEKFAADRGLSSVWLTVNRENEGSISVYRHKGYEIVREQVADIGNGFVMDDYIMEKHI